MLAVEEKNIMEAEQLISSGASINERNKTGQCALIIAAKSGKLELVKLLVANGANIQITNKVIQLLH